MPFLVRRKPSAERECILGFTTRAFEVLRLLADSKSVNDIAGAVSLSSKTAGHQNTHIKSKQGITNIAGLARLAIRPGIITT